MRVSCRVTLSSVHAGRGVLAFWNALVRFSWRVTPSCMSHGRCLCALRGLLHFGLHLREFLGRAVLSCVHVGRGSVALGVHIHECVLHFRGRLMENEHE